MQNKRVEDLVGSGMQNVKFCANCAKSNKK